MKNKVETNLGKYFLAAFIGGILTGPGGLFLSTLTFFLINKSKVNFIQKIKWGLWVILGILPFVLRVYPFFVLSQNDKYLKEVKRSLNDEALKCIIFEFDSGRVRSKISPGNALYKTYIPKNQNECSVYKSKPRNFKNGLRRILFWNSNLDATWFQLEIDQETEEVKKICGDSSKTGCEEGNTW